MLKKITIIYSGIMFVMLFVVMMLLISVSLLSTDLSNNTGLALLDNDTLVLDSSNLYSKKVEVANAQEPGIIIRTDKKSYAINEDVLISFENKGLVSMAQGQESNIPVYLRPGIGNNSEIGFVEQQIGDYWLAIEPVKRCSDKCYEPCNQLAQLPPKNREIFAWSQKLINCSEDDMQTTTVAEPGIYRIVSATWNKQSASYEKIYSNIFNISDVNKIKS